MVVRFLGGFRFLWHGARFVYVEHRGLARIWAFPVLLTGAALVAGVVLAVVYGPGLAAALWAAPEAEGLWGDVLSFVHAAFRWLLVVVLAALGTVTTVALSTVLAAPFNDALSREVERLSRDGATPLGEVSLMVDLGRTLRLELAKLLIYGALMAALLVLGLWLPGVGQVVSSPAALLLSVAFLALDYVDWPAARRGWPVRRRFGLLFRHTSHMLGFGVGVWAMLLVPLLNLLFMPAAVAGGTLMYLAVMENAGNP